MATSTALKTIDNADLWERDRLAALQRFDILDSPREEAFDRITRLIRNIFGVEIGIVSLIDGHRQWYKAVEGLSASETPRKDTFCRRILDSRESIVVQDASLDPRFRDHPSVVGDPHIRFYAGVPLRTDDGFPIGTLCAIDSRSRSFSTRELQILEDLAQIALNEMKLRERATIDVLTGALTRRAFKEEGTRALALAARHEYQLSCLAFDLDNFKVINDSYGHAAGDKVLTAVVRACSAALRESDLIGRLGGEEFAVLLPHTAGKEAALVAEKSRHAIQDLRFVFGGVLVKVTASIGVSEASSASDLETLLETADAAVYRAKQAGRNRVDLPHGLVVKDAPRRRVLKAGQIVLNRNASTIDCTVRSLSETGAGIDVSTTFGIPKEFVLSIPADNLRKRCRIEEQTDKHLDVGFI